MHNIDVVFSNNKGEQFSKLLEKWTYVSFDSS